MKLFNKARTRRRGAALVEYGLIIAGVALVSATAISIFGKKTSDMIGTAAAILPGASGDDNRLIHSGTLIETTLNGDGSIVLDAAAIKLASETGEARLGDNLGLGGVLLVDDGGPDPE